MRFLYNEKELVKNPYVKKVDAFSLKLTTDFRIQLYKVWKENQDVQEIAQMLIDHGFTEDLVGKDFLSSVINGFKLSGFPVYTRSEIALIKDYQEENPLLLYGKYHHVQSGINICPDFEEELFSVYPETAVEDAIRNAGLDPMDVGYQRIQKLKNAFEKRFSEICHERQMPAETANLYVEQNESSGTSPAIDGIRSHPYVKEWNGYTLTLQEAFYNENYLLSTRSLEEIFADYEIPVGRLSQQNRVLLLSKLYRWKPTEDQVSWEAEQVQRIQTRRIKVMDREIETGFRTMGKRLKNADIRIRRQYCLWLHELPGDPWGKYTLKKMLELSDISKSTYYAILTDDQYGVSAKRRASREEEDILLVRTVADYKGFKKGIRQIYMMMPDVTGKQLSMHRIRHLMNKYGIRTTIRRPSKNRKAMKELIARNGKPNLLLRQFRMHRPNEVRLTDVTYLDYGEGMRAYGSASIDPVSGKLVCFVIRENNDLSLALDTLRAMDACRAEPGAIIHSDQGILYMTDDFQKAVKERDLIQSMSRRGNCWDNAPQESFFGHFKDECHYKKCRTLQELQDLIEEYSVYYNHERHMWERKHMTPMEYEAYLLSLSEAEYQSYLKEEEEHFLKKKEKAVQLAVERARAYKNTIEERSGGLADEVGRSEQQNLRRRNRPPG